MVERFKIFILSISMLLLCSELTAQQNRRNLENQRKELNKQIENTSKNLEKISKIKKQEADKLTSLKEKAKSRSEQVSGISSELNVISTKIEDNTEKITENAEVLEKIKSAYKKVLMLLYRNRSNFSAIDIIFSAENFKEHYLRLFYLKRLQKKYYSMAVNLRNEQEQLSSEIQNLKSKKTEKRQKLKQRKEEGGSLNDALEKQENQLKELKSKEKKLQKELAAQEDYKRKLNNKIESIIKEQIAVSKHSARSYESSRNRNSANSNNAVEDFSSNKQYSELGNAFAARKGQLSKPLKGTIISRFGKQKHPLFDHIYTYNNGIDIKASSGAVVRAVYNGSVVSVFTVPGNGNAVMLKHGEFYSTYSNLENVSVRRGDNLKTGAQLGTVGKDMNTGNYLLHFEIWEGKNKEDPEDWLN
jgi:septal ring factor EnvC (AmiA/AmiB activator)